MLRKSYRKQDIENWRNACNLIPEHIRDVENKNAALYEKITSLKHKKTSFEEGKYNQVIHEISVAKAAIKLLELPDTIAALEQEKSSLIEEINNLEKNIEELNTSIAQTENAMEADVDEEKLSALSVEKGKYIGQQSDVYNKVRDLNAKRLNVELQLSRSHELQKNNPQVFSEQKRRQELESSREKLAALDKQCKHYQSELDSYSLTIESANKQIECNNREIANLQLEEREALDQPFLYPYVANPDLLINNLIANLQDVINTYETTSPADQSNDVRIALHELDRLSTIIVQVPRESIDDKQKTTNRLMGLVWHCAELIREDDRGLYDQLRDVVLTGECLDRDDAINDYCLFCISNQLTFMDINALREYEDSEYNSAIVQMTQQINAMPDDACFATKSFYQSGKNLLRTIARQRNRDGRSFDTKFHTTVLKHATDYLREPGNIDHSVKIVDLTEHTSHGKPSFARKLVGAMLMLVGAATSLVGVGLGVSSLGMASPIALPLICAGAAVFTFGAGLYGYGCRRGINKRMGTFHDSGGKAAIAQGLFAQRSSDMPQDASANDSNDSLRVDMPLLSRWD